MFHYGKLCEPYQSLSAGEFHAQEVSVGLVEFGVEDWVVGHGDRKMIE